ncbi:MAG TPA: hypothetical protein VKU60_11690 [Chloroflexota bacterium]|nr:hypothetical protein [Chloroflexota bacterium]
MNHNSEITLLLQLALVDAFPSVTALTATNEAQALHAIREKAPQAVIVAVEDSPAEARRIATALRESPERPARLILMGNRPDLATLDRELGASACVRRPARAVELEMAVREALEESGLPAQREEVRPPSRAEQPRGARRTQHR